MGCSGGSDPRTAEGGHKGPPGSQPGLQLPLDQRGVPLSV